MIWAGYVGFLGLYPLKMEMVSNKYRPVVGLIQDLEFVLGNLLVGFVAYFVTDWRPLQRICASVSLFVPLLYLVLPESVSWLLSKGHMHKAVDTVTKAARMNKRHFPREEAEAVLQQLAVEIEKDARVQEGGTIRDLLMDREARLRFVCMAANWIGVCICWYGLALNIEMLSGNIVTNYMLMSLADLPSAFLCIILVTKVGRKWTLFSCQVLSGALCILSGIITSPSYVPNILCFIGKGLATIAFNIVYLYTAELFPTSIRSTAIGFCSALARIAGMGSPFIAQLKVYWFLLPALALGLPSFLSGLLLVFLPDTKDQGLPETLKQAKSLRDANDFERLRTGQRTDE